MAKKKAAKKKAVKKTAKGGAVKVVDTDVDLLKAVADPVRVRVWFRLKENGKEFVGGLCEALGLPQPTISHHLALMRMAGLVNKSREGKRIYYTVDAKAVGRFKALFG